MLCQGHLACAGFELTTLAVIGTDCIDSYKSNYHTIMTKTAPNYFFLLDRSWVLITRQRYKGENAKTLQKKPVNWNFRVFADFPFLIWKTWIKIRKRHKREMTGLVFSTFGPDTCCILYVMFLSFNLDYALCWLNCMETYWLLFPSGKVNIVFFFFFPSIK